MLKINPIQTNFTSGEQSPQLLGRSDIERYVNGGETIENFFIHPQGGMTYRPGAYNVAPTQSQAENVPSRLMNFTRSRSDALGIEISHDGAGAVFRFMRNGALVMNGANPLKVDHIYGLVNVIPYLATEIDDLQFTQSADIIYIVHPNHKPATLSRYGLMDWRYEIITFVDGPFSDQPGDQTDISITATGPLGNDIPVDRLTLGSTQNEFSLATWPGGTIIEYDVRGTKVIGEITQTFGTTCVIFPYEDLCFVLSKEVYSPGTYLGWNSTESTPTYGPITPGATNVSIAFSNTGVVQQGMIGGYINFQDKAGTYFWIKVTGVDDIVKQGAYGIIAKGDLLTVRKPAGRITRLGRQILATLRSSAPLFDPAIDQVGRKWRLILGGVPVYAVGRLPDPVYSEPAATTQILNVDLSRTLPRGVYGLRIVDEGTTQQWNRGAWFTLNYPAAVGFHQERLTFAGTALEPQSGWLSKSADFYNFAPTDANLQVVDNCAITFTIASDTVNEILWLSSKRVLMIGTVGAEWAITPGAGNAEVLTPMNITVTLQSSFGSVFTKPVSAANALVYLQRGGRKARMMTYDYNVDGQVSVDLTIFAEHILRVHGGGLQLSYQQIPESVIYVRCADGTVAMLAFEPDQKVFAWSRIVLGGGGFIESIISVPEGPTHKLYLSVRRIVEHQLIRTLEYMPTDFIPASKTDFTSVPFLDSYIEFTISGTVTQFTGLEAYMNTFVWVQIGDFFFRDKVSLQGTLDIPAGTVTDNKLARIGYQYPGIYKSFPIETQAQAGSGQGKPKRIDHLILRLQNSTNFSHGWDPQKLRKEDFRKPADPKGAPPPMRSEDFRATFDNGIDQRGIFYITQTEPYPLSVLAIMPEMAQFQ